MPIMQTSKDTNGYPENSPFGLLVDFNDSANCADSPISELDFSQFLSPQFAEQSPNFDELFDPDLNNTASHSPFLYPLAPAVGVVPPLLPSNKAPASLADDEVVTLTVKQLNQLIGKNDRKSSANAKRYSCPSCGRAFARRFNMMTHLKTHDKSRYLVILTETGRVLTYAMSVTKPSIGSQINRGTNPFIFVMMINKSGCFLLSNIRLLRHLSLPRFRNVLHPFFEHAHFNT